MSTKLNNMLAHARELQALGVMSDADVTEIENLVTARAMAERIAQVKAMSGEEIKALRVRFGLSQTLLAHMLGMSKESVSKWERNEIKPSGPALRILNTLAARGPEVFAL